LESGIPECELITAEQWATLTALHGPNGKHSNVHAYIACINMVFFDNVLNDIDGI
jgi:hypothetical protein